MNYYERHLGDYAKDTGHLSLLEHGVYTLLLDRYYATERGLPADQVYRLARARTDDERAAVDVVLGEFFVMSGNLWVNGRVEEELEKARGRIASARENGKKGGRPAKTARKEPEGNPAVTQEKPSGFPLGSENETGLKAHQAPPNHLSNKRRSKSTVQPAAALLRFDDFWSVYPNKKGKQEAEKAWGKQGLTPRCDELIAHVRLMHASDDGWRRGYIPMASTYLNQARWTDVPNTITAGAGNEVTRESAADRVARNIERAEWPEQLEQSGRPVIEGHATVVVAHGANLRHEVDEQLR